MVTPIFLSFFFNIFSDKNPAFARMHVDYIQNILLESFNTIQSQHFAQKQIALFVLTIQWYFFFYLFFFHLFIYHFRWVHDSEHKQVFAFISTYTKHDSIFSVHCIRTFMENFVLPPQIRYLYFGSDGGSHFKSTYVFMFFSFFFLIYFSSTMANLFFTLFHDIKYKVFWVIDSASHGKGLLSLFLNVSYFFRHL